VTNLKRTRPSKLDYYLDIAQVVASRGTCLRRNFGAIIVKNDQIKSTGYVGAPRGRKNCIDLDECPRQKANIPAGERYELCRSSHAEANAIIQAQPNDMLDATMYVVGISAENNEVISNGNSCAMCKRAIINSGISQVIYRDPSKPDNHHTYNVRDWIFDDDSLSGDHKGY
jgi:dCMP deaminase